MPVNRAKKRTSTSDPIRLSKRLSELGLCSRREADKYIEKGWVKVDGQTISELGFKVTRGQSVELLDKARKVQDRQATFLLNKPPGYVSGQPEKDKPYPPAVKLLRAENLVGSGRMHHTLLRGLAPAGRLDIDSRGLLVLTQDGRVARKLIGEDSGVEKEYVVYVEGKVTPDILKKLEYGLSLDGKKLKPAKIKYEPPSKLRMVLKEGRKRQIRRMCDLVGLKVTGLCRVRIGKVHLGDLEEGKFRFLKDGEKF